MSILFGVAWYKPDKRFQRDYPKFVEDCSLKYEVTEKIVEGKTLVEAQNEIADTFLKSDCEWLLMLEDDHWGHTPEMLDALFEANKPYVAMKYYSRHIPYQLAILDYGNSACYNQLEEECLYSGKDYIEVDLVGFGMTLLHRSLFFYLDQPYFQLSNDAPLSKATDRDFARRLKKHGIRPTCCLRYCLNHRDVTQESVYSLRQALFYKEGMAAFILKSRLAIRKYKLQLNKLSQAPDRGLVKEPQG